MADESIKSPFYEPALASGGTFVEEGGWFWGEGFGDQDAEYRGVREDLGVWDVSPLNKWEFTGKDALAAAQRIHSNNILGLAVGQVRYGCSLDADGMVIDDGTVYRRREDSLWVMTGAADMMEYFTEATEGLDVGITSVTQEMPHVGIQGPRSREALAALCPADIANLGYFRFLPDETTVGGVPCIVSRTGFGGEMGYELFVRPEHAADLWAVVVDQMKAQPFGTGVLECLRAEAGLIVLDYDYEAGQRTPYDLSLDKMVALDKVEFLGADALRSVAANPPRRMKTLVLEGDEVPEYGAEVTRDGEVVGVLTTPAASPKFGVIGMAILETFTANDGDQVDVSVGEGTRTATVAPLGILDPEKKRPRGVA